MASCHLYVPGEIANNDHASFLFFFFLEVGGGGGGLKRFIMGFVQVENYADQAEFFYRIKHHGECFTNHATRNKEVSASPILSSWP